MTSFSKWDRDAYRARVGEEEAARRRGAIMAKQWGFLPIIGLASVSSSVSNLF